MSWPEPGIHEDVPFADYIRLDAVSSTFLKAFRDLPAKALTPKESTPDMLLGSAIHAYCLEGPAAFAKSYAILPASDLNKNSTAYKAQHAEFVSWAGEREVLPSTYGGVPTLDILRGVESALLEHPMAGRILTRGRRELSLVWEDEGQLCKARIDHDPGNRCLVDLKKTRDASAFCRQLVQLSYDLQASWYMRGATACGLQPDTFLFIAVEADPPYPVTCGYLDHDWVEWGHNECARLLGLVAQCKQRQTWPTYTIPYHIHSLDDLQPEMLLREWTKPEWR